MAKLSYRLPERNQEAEAIKTMPPDKVGRLRDEVTFRLQGVIDSCNDYFENLIESNCSVCESLGHAYFDIPPGWGWLSSTGNLLCSDCINRWTNRFGSAPEINREGEVVYEYSSVSEATAHWGQTDFEFV